MSAGNGLLSDFAYWCHLFDDQKDIFSSLLPGASIGFLSREELGFREARVLIWKKQDDEMMAQYSPFTALRNVGVDLLFVTDNESLEELYSDGEQLFHNMNRLIREGGILFFVFKTKDKLLDLGFEGLLDSLGLTMHGCVCGHFK